MVDILHRVGVAAPPQAVLSALTTLEGLQGWWVSSIEGAAGKGETFAFRANQLHVVEAGPHRVIWRYSGPATEWVGTLIEFRLEWRDIQTLVLFKHEGWKEPVEFMHHCSTKWAVFLLSLKDWVETGAGRPEPRDTRIAVDG